MGITLCYKYENCGLEVLEDYREGALLEDRGVHMSNQYIP